VKWKIKCGNILDERVDVLICSANVFLNLSGGVGGQLLGRYGMKMQNELHRHLKDRIPHAAKRGEIFTYTDPKLPYKAILHTVAIDGWYHSSAKIIEEVTVASLKICQSLNADSVALTALATGFGNLTLAEFAEGIRPVMAMEFPPITDVVICLYEDYRTAELQRHLF
jgi:O-acetyl-ADP-ribose deacetylase (regulator of RNase III)